MTQPAPWVVFAWVLANQAGVPVPVAPWLVAAGALAGGGQGSLALILAGAVGAALGADLLWYALGRWRGAPALARCFRLLRLAPAAVDRVGRAFEAHQGRFAWSARFLPELNPVAAGLAGATRVAPLRFLGHAVGSAAAWVGVWTGAGYLVGRVVPGPSALASIVGGVTLLAAVAASTIVVVAARRRRPSTPATRRAEAPAAAAPGRGAVASAA